MASRKELDEEIADNFGGRIIRDVSGKRVLVSQVQQPHLSREDMEGLAEALIAASGMCDPHLLTPLYEKAKENLLGSFFDQSLPGSKPYDWIACAAEAVVYNFLNTPEGSRFQDFRLYLRDGSRDVARRLMEASADGVTPTFARTLGNTSDNRPIISSCPVPRSAKKLFGAFYDVIKDDITDPSGNLVRVVDEMKSTIRT